MDRGETSVRKFCEIHMKAGHSKQECNQNPFKRKQGVAVNQVAAGAIEPHHIESSQRYRPDRNLPQQPGRKGEPGPPPVCYYCGVTGHIIRGP